MFHFSTYTRRMSSTEIWRWPTCFWTKTWTVNGGILELPGISYTLISRQDKGQTISNRPSHFSCRFKGVFGRFFYFRKIVFYIYIYCRRYNSESNKLIKTVGHRARLLLFFRENDVWLYLDIFIFSLITSLSCNKPLNMLGMLVVCINRM